MITWSTYILAKCPITGDVVEFNPEIYIEAPTKALALQYAQDNGLGYLHIDGPLVFSVDCKTGNRIDFDYYKN